MDWECFAVVTKAEAVTADETPKSDLVEPASTAEAEQIEHVVASGPDPDMDLTLSACEYTADGEWCT